jgi:hypothetical protein
VIAVGAAVVGDVAVDGTASEYGVLGGIMVMLGYASYGEFSTGRAPPGASGSGTKPEPDRTVGSIGVWLSGTAFTQLGVSTFFA